MKLFNLLVLVSAAFMLAACGAIGVKRAPDELAVIEGPSLALPPDYALRPPKDERVNEAELRRERTEKIIIGETKPAVVTEDQGDLWLLEQAGALEADPEIREKLEKDNEVIVEEEKKGWFTKQKERIIGTDAKEEAAE